MKSISLILIQAASLFCLFSCNKEKKTGQVRSTDIIGEWQMVCKFYDTDSNGLDEGDSKYPSNPQDSFNWVFQPDNKLQFKEKGKLVYTGYWFLTWPNNAEGVNELFLYPDPDLRNFVYKIQIYRPDYLVFYCKQFEIEFGVLKYRWYGWELKR